jgi:hypothetical protein
VDKCKPLVETMEPMLKVPATKRLKLRYDDSPAKFAFKFNLRCYMMELNEDAKRAKDALLRAIPTVGRCRLTLSKPR